MSTQDTIAILGGYPPPYGGVSNHVQRLVALLEEHSIPYRVYNAASRAENRPHVISVYSHRYLWMVGYTLWGREPTVYMMSDRLSAWVAGALMARVRGKRVIVQLRNEYIADWEKKSSWRRAVAKAAMKTFSGVVAVNTYLAEVARKLGVDEDRLLWAPGFLPPLASSFDRKGVHPSVWRFLQDRSPVIAANGKVLWYRDTDVYGLDLMVELARTLKPIYPDFALVVCFLESERPGEPERIAELRVQIARYGLQHHVLLNTHKGVFLPVLAEADVFLRPTSTDGDACSVREALAYGIPAVVSDCVPRPDGVYLFQNRNLDDLRRVVQQALDANPSRRAPRAMALSDELNQRVKQYLDFITGVAPRPSPIAPAHLTAPHQ